MTSPRTLLAAAAFASAAVVLSAASGMVGVYGIVEKVVFEPGEATPDRVQLWGAFAYVDASTGATSAASRGYLYLQVPTVIPGFTSESQVKAIRTEWADLKTLAGTGQAVGFGSWSYIGGFSALEPAVRPTAPSVILERVPRGGSRIDLRVRPANEAPVGPATYQTESGVVKLTEGTHSAVIATLRAALKR